MFDILLLLQWTRMKSLKCLRYFTIVHTHAHIHTRTHTYIHIVYICIMFGLPKSTYVCEVMVLKFIL